MRIILAITAIATCSVPAVAADLKIEAGFGKVDVTPTEPVRLSGYGNRNHASEGVDTPLHARALALRPQDGETFVLVSFDTIGTPASFTDDVAQTLQGKFGIERERFALAGTHSHTSPHLANGLSNLFATPLSDEERQAAERYTAFAKQAIVDAVGKAIDDLKPSMLSVGKGSAGFAMNRRVVKDSNYQGFGVTPAGAVDHTVDVLKIAGLDGALRGVVFNYACHATTLEGHYYRVNGDWPAYAAGDVEEAHPGITALCTIGCGADANPEPRGGDRPREHAEAHGRALALAVGKAIEETAPVASAPVASFGFAGLPFDRPSKEELTQKLNDASPQVARHAANMLETLDRMGRLPETYPMPIQTWQFGDDLTMVFFGGEVVVDFATRLKKEIDSRTVWVTAYANDVFGYVASERVRSEGGYEVDYSMIFYNLPGRWSTGTEDLVVRRVHEILKNPAGEPALSPEDERQSFHLPDGFEIDLVASEPLIADPVSFAFGPDGRLWVVEMGDYPRGGDGNGAPGGKIKVLTDENADGVFDHATVFVDGLSFPNGVIPWRDGALVSCAPDVFFARDTNGDGTADEREVLLTGFPESNPQHRVNGFTYGLDGLMHLAHGANGITSPKTGAMYDLAGRDFALNPDTGEVIATSGDSQFGRCCTDDDVWFGNTNSEPLFQYVIEDRYLKRNPHVRLPNPKVQLITGGETRVFPASRTVDRFNDLFALNRFTSACSPTIFRDAAFEHLNGAAFICEPVHNLVRCVALTPEGATFVASRFPEGEREFLASADPWCRPVKAATGPDGALWVADMYRLVIEHPEWIPEAWQARLDLRAGADKGRIWRVRPAGRSSGPLPNLTSLPMDELIDQFGSRNGAIRDLARQLLIWRHDKSAVAPLRKLATNENQPQSQLQALSTLAGIGELDAATLRQVMSECTPEVARFAVRLSEPFLNENPDVGELVVRAAEREASMQVALSLGEWDDARAGAALGALATKTEGDRWLRAAVLTSAVKHADRILAAVLLDGSDEAGEIAADLVATVLGADRERGPERVLDALRLPNGSAAPDWQIAAVARVADAASDKPHSTLAAHETVRQSLAAARKTSADATSGVRPRGNAIALLGGPFGTDADRNSLASLLSPQSPPEVQNAVVEAFAKSGAADVPGRLLSGWSGHLPRLRETIVQTLLTRPEWSTALLDGVSSGALTVGDFSAAARERLTSSPDTAIQQRAAKLFGASVSSDRSALIARYEPTLTQPGDPERGRILFEKSCASCHKLGGIGNNFGPNLAALTDKSPQALLVAVLDPNRAVEAKYRGYVAVTRDGRILSGLIVQESTASITFAGADGRTVELLRKEIDELRDSGKSFMPEGLERDLPPQDLTDVVAFVRSARE
ncbi:MAG: neutral/alkaline non-lysosomal ceramidase N-terminal domain-containing protein [Planctomycetota bacterium]|nr:neutral/alkaline non-lysosomal ceramidase N-terminal domain-containing protein [Planctomycetaceae bacterium]MDQ3329641.1 neutral/alkaline non-lysosomal ceramidase N-terminal domain-containing protein [Planctomycetota bacterium]